MSNQIHGANHFFSKVADSLKHAFCFSFFISLFYTLTPCLEANTCEKTNTSVSLALNTLHSFLTNEVISQLLDDNGALARGDGLIVHGNQHSLSGLDAVDSGGSLLALFKKKNDDETFSNGNFSKNPVNSPHLERSAVAAQKHVLDSCHLHTRGSQGLRVAKAGNDGLAFSGLDNKASAGGPRVSVVSNDGGMGAERKKFQEPRSEK